VKPRVLHVIPFLWSGAGNVVTRLCLSQQAGWDVALVTSGRSKGQKDWPAYRGAIAVAHVRHHTIDFFDRDAATFWNGVDMLGSLVSSWRPDVVHTHAGVAACATAAVRDGSSHRFRHVNHVYNWGVGRPAWMNTMDLAGIRRADTVVCSAQAYRELLLRNGIPARRIAYVPWGLDLDAIRAAARPPARRRSTAPRIGFVGRIEPRKGQLELVRGFARYLREAPGAQLELVGPVADQDYAARIASVVQGHRLEDAVKLTGQVRNPYRRLAEWNLFVSLSSDEGQGLAALEAMALGVPVLARPAAGIEDYLVDGINGWACPGVSAQAVAHSMRRAFADPNRARVTARARAMVDRRYGWDRTVDAVRRLYRGCAASSGGRAASS
jgi:hypothetical protein